MPQIANAGRMGLPHATVNRILLRHAATGTLVPGKSAGAPWKTTPRQDHALFRMVRQSRFISARVLMVQMKNLYGTRTGQKTINHWLLSRSNHACWPTRKPLLTANHQCLHLEWAQRWQNLTMPHWLHVIFSDKFRSQLYPVDGRLMVHCSPGERFQQRCQAYRVQAGGGSVHIWGGFHCGAKSPIVLPDRYLTSELYRGILLNTLVLFAWQHFGDNYRYKDDNATPQHAPCLISFSRAASSRWSSHRTYLRCIGPWNHQYGQPAP